jgi:hypothetical protein
VSGPPLEPSADSITVVETLELLEGRFAALSRGIADGRYVLWVGSGISRERLPDLSALILKVLGFLHERIIPGRGDCPHRRALEQAVGMAGLRPDERAQFELDDSPHTWPVLNFVLNGLRGRYSEVLDIRVDGEPADYLLWEAVDVRATYGPSIEPDCEHLCIGILVLEGAVSEVASANWDGLIEAALAELAGDAGAIVRVVVLPDELREPDRALTLLKFHGCAVLATRNPSKYRTTLVATRPQITMWNSSPETKPIRDEMVSLATTKPTLMIGLSAQDENIQRVFAQARADMQWSWPANPPAHVFADDQLGADHINILRVVYGDDYDVNALEIEQQALIRAYGKPLLTALVLSVLTEKLRAFLAEAEAPYLGDSEREQLADGLKALGRRLASAADSDRLLFVKRLVSDQGRALALFQEGAESPAGAPSYRPLSSLPADRVKTDSALPTSGVRELAAALALLGRGEVAGNWSLSLGPTTSGVEGALKVTSGGSDTAVFFAANGRAAVRLRTEGILEPAAGNTIIIHSTEPVEPVTRSARGKYGRTRRRHGREVDMYELLNTSPDLAALEDGFRHAATL